MLESQNVNNSVSYVKGLSKEELFDYAKDYLKKCSYVSCKKLATAYLFDYYKLGYRDLEYIRLLKVLRNRFRYTIMLLTQKGLIVGYNNSRLYMRVDAPITQEVPKSNNKSELIYYQGKFINPKFYDIVGEMFNILDPD